MNQNFPGYEVFAESYSIANTLMDQFQSFITRRKFSQKSGSVTYNPTLGPWHQTESQKKLNSPFQENIRIDGRTEGTKFRRLFRALQGLQITISKNQKHLAFKLLALRSVIFHDTQSDIRFLFQKSQISS